MRNVCDFNMDYVFCIIICTAFLKPIFIEGKLCS
uniref:Uncharacterized protein n=1 Tax=Anguilla anguilla TaxID=7936 RepID=A0A0E9QVL1_ANGAN